MTTDAAPGTRADDDQAAAVLRETLADQVTARYGRRGRELPAAVAAALRAVPRHLFTPPGVPLGRAYADDPVVAKVSGRGVAVSSVSAPSLIAGMLAQLDVRPGQSVLELGSGGYNAALLQELAGPSGSVTTLDIDPEVIDRARACLDAAGYRDVRTVLADGEYGAAEYAPFDRIIVTAGSWDVPPSWAEQMAPGGRIVVPLRTRGMTRSWVLEQRDGWLAGHSPAQCGFVPVQGEGEHRGRGIPLHGDDVNLWTDEDAALGGGALDGVLALPRAESWSGVTLPAGEDYADQDLWLAALPGFCQLVARPGAIEQQVVDPSWRWGTPALASGQSIAYRARPRPAGAGRGAAEFGAYGHGPQGSELAGRLSEAIRGWDRARRAGQVPVLAVHPAGTPDDGLPAGLVLPKRHAKIVLSWSVPGREA